MKKRRKRKISNLLFGLLFAVGFGVLVYPSVSNQWNTYRQSQLISSYETIVEEMTEEDFSDEWEKARAFNDTIVENNLYADVFGQGEGGLEDTEYWKVLNLANDGIMGYISIPKINIKLAIYHGVEESVLQTGVGHLNGSKLPIGGESTHSVLAAHRGLPSARLFTDIDQLDRGDVFYIHMLDEILAYQVDAIHDMVDKDDMDTLSELLKINEGEDRITLFTCTPYGVNSHRLLVSASRIEYNGEEEVEVTVPEAMLQSVQDYYMLYLVLGLSITVLVILLMRFFLNKKSKRKDEGE